ncbi:MAG: sulfotransferase family protein [Candidatus Woesearchaeota archaeon]
MHSFKKIVSIHGAPRSGTTWLGQIIDSSPEIRYKYQPLFSESFKDAINVGSTKKEMLETLENIYLKEDEFLDREKQKKTGIHKRFPQKKEQPPYLAIKHVRYHYLIPHFLNTLENIKVIGIVRHPCGVLNSWRKAPREFLPEHNFYDNWRFAQDRSHFRPEEYYGFHRWIELTKMFLEMQKNFPEKFKLLRYENLVKFPAEETQKIFYFCSLPYPQQTEEFLNESTSLFDEDTYSVYKGGKKLDDWKEELNYEIIKTVYRELEDTEFKDFLKY